MFFDFCPTMSIFTENKRSTHSRYIKQLNVRIIFYYSTGSNLGIQILNWRQFQFFEAAQVCHRALHLSFIFSYAIIATPAIGPARQRLAVNPLYTSRG